MYILHYKITINIVHKVMTSLMKNNIFLVLKTNQLAFKIENLLEISMFIHTYAQFSAQRAIIGAAAICEI